MLVICLFDIDSKSEMERKIKNRIMGFTRQATIQSVLNPKHRYSEENAFEIGSEL